MGTLAIFLEWWVGPLPEGVMDAVFPSVVEILIREDDTQTITVTYPSQNGLIVDGTEMFASSNFNSRWI